jgi:hypothetical protein
MQDQTRRGRFRQYVPGPIMNFVIVADFGQIYANVEKFGGPILMPNTAIQNVGLLRSSGTPKSMFFSS